MCGHAETSNSQRKPALATSNGVFGEERCNIRGQGSNARASKAGEEQGKPRGAAGAPCRGLARGTAAARVLGGWKMLPLLAASLGIGLNWNSA